MSALKSTSEGLPFASIQTAAAGSILSQTEHLQIWAGQRTRLANYVAGAYPYLALDARIWMFTDYYSLSPGMVSQTPGKGAKYMIAFTDGTGTVALRRP